MKLNKQWTRNVAKSADWLQDQGWEKIDKSVAWAAIAEDAMIYGLQSVPDKPTGIVYGYVNHKRLLKRPMTLAELMRDDP